jgi:dihydroxyacetone kinase
LSRHFEAAVAILDALAPSLDALAKAGPGQALHAMVAAAQAGVDSTTGSPGRRGRASWIGERRIGHPDPGVALYVELLTAIRDSVQKLCSYGRLGQPV